VEESERSESEVAADALRVAIACARSDGRFEAAEIEGIERLIEDRFSPTALEKKRLDLLREELKVGSIDVSGAAARLRMRLGPLERRLLVEGILDALLAKGPPAEAEIQLLGAVAEKLDLPTLVLKEMKSRSEPPRKEAGGEREKWLSALELPGDVQITRELVERSVNRILDSYSEERFAGLGSEFRTLARKRREGAEEARRELLASLPPGEPEDPAEGREASPGEVIRRNPDLDDIFGS